MSNQKLAGKVALITGAARGQGRVHAIKLHPKAPTSSRSISPARSTPFGEKISPKRSRKKLDRRAYSAIADVRDFAALKKAVDAGIAELGRLDIVVANAGILNAVTMSWELSEDDWDDMLDINLKGVWHTTKVAIPHLLEQNEGGSIILISSTAGYRGIPGIVHYNAAKHGVRGIARTLANELAQNRIRVNSVHPTNVRTTMIENPTSAKIYRPNLQNPTFEDSIPALAKINMWPVPYIESVDVANAVLFLASDDSRYITGIGLPVDLGMIEKYSGA